MDVILKGFRPATLWLEVHLPNHHGPENLPDLCYYSADHL